MTLDQFIDQLQKIRCSANSGRTSNEVGNCILEINVEPDPMSTYNIIDTVSTGKVESWNIIEHKGKNYICLTMEEGLS